MRKIEDERKSGGGRRTGEGRKNDDTGRSEKKRKREERSDIGKKGSEMRNVEMRSEEKSESDRNSNKLCRREEADHPHPNITQSRKNLARPSGGRDHERRKRTEIGRGRG